MIKIIDIYGYSVATLPAIAAAVYGIIEFLKNFVFSNNEKFKKYIQKYNHIILKI